MILSRACLALFLTLLVLAGPAASAVSAGEPDWQIPNGRQFTQAGSYTVLDDEEARFWTEFQNLGGVGRLGYPISGRFVYKGFTTQAFQKLALQWWPDKGRALFLNVFDELSQAGKDDWLLTVRSTPMPVQVDERGKEWPDIVAGRITLLDANPAIRGTYMAAPNPIGDYGLPTSQVEDLGPLFALRTQRVVFQQWKVETPWAKAGQVIVANGGDLAKEAGLFPQETLAQKVLKFQSASTWPPQLELINRYRAAAGVRPAEINSSLDGSASSHVRYYDANRGDPSLAGMGLHKETPGRPEFTGATMGERARAAGYSGGIVTENAGYGNFTNAVDWYMNSVNHRLPLIHPSALDMGYAESPASHFSIVAVGLRQDKQSASSVSVYPAPDADDVPTSWDGGETPDPAPGLPRPLGYPITVAFALNHKVEWKSFALSGSDGQAVDVAVSRTDWMRAAGIIPTRPLQRGATYTVQVEATVDGQPFSKAWSFTTAP